MNEWDIEIGDKRSRICQIFFICVLIGITLMPSEIFWTGHVSYDGWTFNYLKINSNLKNLIFCNDNIIVLKEFFFPL